MEQGLSDGYQLSPIDGEGVRLAPRVDEEGQPVSGGVYTCPYTRDASDCVEAAISVYTT